MRKQYIVVLTANAENISTTKLVVDSLLNQDTDVQYKVVLLLSDRDFNSTTEVPFDLYMLGLRQKIQILLCSNVRQTIRSKFSDDNVIEAEHREVAPNWLQSEIECGKKIEQTQPEKVEKLSSVKPDTNEPEIKSVKPQKSKKRSSSTPVVKMKKEESPLGPATVICGLKGDLAYLLFQITTARYFAKQHNIADVLFYHEDSWIDDEDIEFYAWTNINEILKEPINVIGSKTEFKNGRRTVDAKETAPTEFAEIRYEFKPSDFDAPNVHITGWRLNLRYFTKEFFKSMLNLGSFAEISRRMYGDLSDTAAIYVSANEDSFDEDDILAIRKKFPDDDFIIFSDDIEWCKDALADLNFQFRQESKIVDTNEIGYSERIDSDQFIDLVAMSQCYAMITDDSLLAWVSAWISERPGHITAYKENAFEDVLIPSDDKTWMTFDKFLAI